MEAELMAITSAGEEDSWLRDLLSEILIWDKLVPPILLYYDSTTAIGRVHNKYYNGKSRAVMQLNYMQKKYHTTSTKLLQRFKYMEEEGIQHFSHDEHPLIMIEVQKNNDNGDGDDKKITHPMHPKHPLVLHREPPYSSGSCTCHACGQKGWKFFTYNCSFCKFDLDISCASQDRFAREGQSDLGDPGRNLVKLSSNDAAQNFIKLSLLQCSITSSLRKMSTEEKIILTMLEPILLSDPHYPCAEGDYFLHKTCYQFPDELQTPKHPEHSLTPMTVLAVAGYFRCHACLKEGNCLYYECKCCKFYICIKCVSASLTSAVLHNSHKHLLTQVENTNRITCNACGFDRGSFGFGCEDCHFYLDCECALMLPTTKQKWDEHVLVLTYPPFVEHPDEFCCAICDLQMNPNEWMYHCHECDQLFHPWCIPQIHQNTKFGVPFLIMGKRLFNAQSAAIVSVQIVLAKGQF
nr:uncharacterized protein LOC113705710 [Coffea arabica]